jgi:hypothetical protein
VAEGEGAAEGVHFGEIEHADLLTAREALRGKLRTIERKTESQRRASMKESEEKMNFYCLRCHKRSQPSH